MFLTMSVLLIHNERLESAEAKEKCGPSNYGRGWVFLVLRRVGHVETSPEVRMGHCLSSLMIRTRGKQKDRTIYKAIKLVPIHHMSH